MRSEVSLNSYYYFFNYVLYFCFCCVWWQQYFGEIRNELFLVNELFLKDPEDVYSRSARPSASYTY